MWCQSGKGFDPCDPYTQTLHGTAIYAAPLTPQSTTPSDRQSGLAVPDRSCLGIGCEMRSVNITVPPPLGRSANHLHRLQRGVSLQRVTIGEQRGIGRAVRAVRTFYRGRVRQRRAHSWVWFFGGWVTLAIEHFCRTCPCDISA